MELNIVMDPITVFNQSPIKGTFVAHFMIINCALNILAWLPTIYLMYNMFFFICLLWALHSPSNPESVQLAAIINVISILFDIMCISTNYRQHNYLDWFGFSLFLLICNLVLRPVTSFILLRVYNQRQSCTSYSNIDNGGLREISDDRINILQTRTGYEDIDSNASTHPSSIKITPPPPQSAYSNSKPATFLPPLHDPPTAI